MDSKTTAYGNVFIGNKEQIFEGMLEAISSSQSREPLLGLSGGSTPKAFYEWCVKHAAKTKPILENCIWSTSDERCVQIDSEESNFGNLDRMLLSKLELTHKKPWPTELEPNEAASIFSKDWENSFGVNRAFDVCFLGMGDDCHIASLFPNCPLIGSGASGDFAATNWPSRGWRLTITESGLAHCQKIVITVLGENKAEAVKSIFEGEYEPKAKPAQLLKQYAKNVYWLLDTGAASKLNV